VGLRGWEERQVVATVGQCGTKDTNNEPQPCHREVGSHDDRSEARRGKVDY